MVPGLTRDNSFRSREPSGLEGVVCWITDDTTQPVNNHHQSFSTEDICHKGTKSLYGFSARVLVLGHIQEVVDIVLLADMVS